MHWADNFAIVGSTSIIFTDVTGTRMKLAVKIPGYFQPGRQTNRSCSVAASSRIIWRYKQQWNYQGIWM